MIEPDHRELLVRLVVIPQLVVGAAEAIQRIAGEVGMTLLFQQPVQVTDRQRVAAGDGQGEDLAILREQPLAAFDQQRAAEGGDLLDELWPAQLGRVADRLLDRHAPLDHPVQKPLERGDAVAARDVLQRQIAQQPLGRPAGRRVVEAAQRVARRLGGGQQIGQYASDQGLAPVGGVVGRAESQPLGQLVVFGAHLVQQRRARHLEDDHLAQRDLARQDRLGVERHHRATLAFEHQPLQRAPVHLGCESGGRGPLISQPEQDHALAVGIDQPQSRRDQFGR